MTTGAARRLSESAALAPEIAVDAAADALRANTSRDHAEVLARTLRALAQSVASMDAKTTREALGATSDYEALLLMLQQPRSLASLVKSRGQDPLLAAHIRGLANRSQLMQAEGGIVSASTAMQLLGISPQALYRRRKSGKILAVTAGRREWVYPCWQFTEAGMLPGLETVLRELRAHDPWMQLAFMVNGNTRLGGHSPLERLREGRVQDVVEAARMYGEIGAA